MLVRVIVLTLLATSGNVTVDAVYPNPATPGDTGEFVVLDVTGDLSGDTVTLTDGEDEIRVDGLETGTIAVTDAPALVRNRTDLPIHVVDEFLALRNGGEQVAVRIDGRTVSTLSYPRGPEANLYRDGTWTPPRRSDVSSTTVSNVSATAFVLPDAAEPFQNEIGDADSRVLLGGYTFADPAVADALIRAHRRGVDVEVLLEGGPVGGISSNEVTQVDRLVAAGVPVELMGTEQARYDFHHAKYAVVDDRVLIASENWKPGGTGGHGSRGWATVLRDERLASELAAIFESDSEWLDTRSWDAARPSDPVAVTADNTTFPDRFEPRRFEADRATLLVAPDNAEAGVRTLLDGAEDSILVEQVSIQPDGVLLNRTIGAARRGVEVKILVSGAWFVEEENREFVANLRRTARREDLPMKARVVEPRSRFEYVHTKGVIVDGRSVVVGSLNWNEHALTENREVALRIDDPAVASYFGRTFLADWRGAAWRVPWGLVGGGLLVLLLGLGFAVRFGTFEDRQAGADEW